MKQLYINDEAVDVCMDETFVYGKTILSPSKNISPFMILEE